MPRRLRGWEWERPVTRSLTPQWDLTLVLRALVKAPFEPLDRVPLKFVSAKTALLLVLTSAKRVSDLSALSVAPSCLRIQGDGSSAILRPNPAFTPKSITSLLRSRVIILNGFSLPPHQSEEEATVPCKGTALGKAITSSSGKEGQTSLDRKCKSCFYKKDFAECRGP